MSRLSGSWPRALTPSTSGPRRTAPAVPGSSRGLPEPGRPTEARPAPCEIGEHTFGIAPHGWGKYRFCLDHDLARIGFSTSRHLPTVRIQPRIRVPPCGWARGGRGDVARNARARAGAAPLGQPGRSLRRLAGLDALRRCPPLRLPGRGPSYLRSRRDLDRLRVRVPQDQDPAGSSLQRPRRQPRTPAGGTRSGASATCTACPCTDSNSGCSHQVLVEFDLNTPDQVLTAAGDLWAYATGEWLTYRSPRADQTPLPLAPGPRVAAGPGSEARTAGR